MVDHHVDRPDVQARQRVQLTGTNRSTGLNALILDAHLGISNQVSDCCAEPRAENSLLQNSVFRRPGGHSEEPIPDPIPNSAVKVLCADGTESQDLEE